LIEPVVLTKCRRDFITGVTIPIAVPPFFWPPDRPEKKEMLASTEEKMNVELLTVLLLQVKTPCLTKHERIMDGTGCQEDLVTGGKS